MSVIEKYTNLVCPGCHSDLVREATVLSCAECNRSYHTVNEVPVFFEDQSVNEDLREMSKLVALMERKIDGNFKEIAENFYLPNKKFSKAIQKTTTKSFRNLETFFPDLRNMRILNLSSGIGRDALFLVERGCGDLYLSDISLPAVAYSKKIFERYFPDLSLNYLVTDCAQIPYPDGFFDLVLVYGAIHHYPDIAAFVRETKRVSSNLCILSEPAVMGGMNWLLEAVGWNTEYGDVDTARIDEQEMRSLLAANGFDVEVERLWTYFPRALSRFSGNRYLLTSWFAFLAGLDRFLPGTSHSINFFARTRDDGRSP